MKKIMRWLGYVPIYDLLNDSLAFDKKQTEVRDELLKQSLDAMPDKESARDKFIDALQESYQGIGAMRFINEFLEKL
jgi:hypothetical protein